MKDKPQMVNVGPIRFPAPITERLDQVADMTGHTRSSLIRHAVRVYLASHA